MLGVSEAIERRCSSDPCTARIFIEARLDYAAAIKQRGDQWNAADGGLSSDFEVLGDGGLRLKATASAAVGPSTVTSGTTFYRSKESGYAGPFIDPLSNVDGTLISGGHEGVNLQWRGNNLKSYGSMQAWLHPRYDATKAKRVKTWQMELFEIHGPFNVGRSILYSLAPVLSVRVPANGEAAGWVIFPFQDAAGKAAIFNPKPFVASGVGGFGNRGQQPGTEYVVLCHGFDASGAPAPNIGWGYDNGNTSYVVGGLSFIGIQLGVTPISSNGLPTNGGVTRRSSATDKIMAVQFVPVSFPASATITFALGDPVGGLFDLGLTPSSPPELVLQTELPSGTSVVGEVAAANLIDNTGLETNDDGWNNADLLGLTATVVRSNAQAHTGSWSFKCTTTNVDYSGIRIERRLEHTVWPYDAFEVTAGQSYTLKCWVYAPAGSVGKSLRIGVAWSDVLDTHIPVTLETFTTLALGWQQMVVTGVAPATAALAELFVATNGAQGVFDFYADDAEFSETATGSNFSYVTFLDGEATSYPNTTPAGYTDLGLPTVRAYAMRVTLNSNGDGSRSPILRGLGVRAIATRDLGDVADLTQWDERIDPMTHVSEVGECTLSVIHDGIKDYRDDITRLLSENPPGDLSFRVLVGHRDELRSTWLHREDFSIDDSNPEGAQMGITGVSVLSRLRQALPKLVSDSVAVPISDISNPGGYGAAGGPTGYDVLADVASGTTIGTPDDTTYLQGGTNPTNAQFTAGLSGISTPAAAIPNQVLIQARAAIGAGTACSLKIELMEGATVRATLGSVSITAVDAGQGSYQPISYGLTAAEVLSITNWRNLRFRFSATGVGGTYIRIGWARLVVLGARADLQYPSSATPANTIQDVRDDLLDNQIALDRRYRGPSYVDTTPPLVVAKTIRTDPGGETDLTRAKQELDYLNRIAGHGDIASQGRIKTIPLYSVTAYTDLITGTATAAFSPLAGPVRAVIPIEEVEPISTSPGWRQRTPFYGVPYGWDGQRYAGEAQIANLLAASYFAPALIDPETRTPAGMSQWISGDGLARGISIRHGQMFGLGCIEWRVRFTQPRPWLEIGDLITFGTDRFVAFDPIATRAIAGRQWVTAMINGRWDGMGREFSVWVQTYAAIQKVPGGGLIPPAETDLLTVGFSRFTPLDPGRPWTYTGDYATVTTASGLPYAGYAHLTRPELPDGTHVSSLTTHYWYNTTGAAGDFRASLIAFPNDGSALIEVAFVQSSGATPLGQWLTETVAVDHVVDWSTYHYAIYTRLNSGIGGSVDNARFMWTSLND